jgi:hypothetical protein
MKISIICVPIFYRTPNCTFVNVGQFKPKFYRKHFQIGLLDNIYAQIARAEFHLKGQDNRSYSALASLLLRRTL